MPIEGAEIDSGYEEIKTKTGPDEINVGITAATKMYIRVYIYVYSHKHVPTVDCSAPSHWSSILLSSPYAFLM